MQAAPRPGVVTGKRAAALLMDLPARGCLDEKGSRDAAGPACQRLTGCAGRQVATAICSIMPIWESRAGLWTVCKNMVMCRPAVDEVALSELKADLEKPHMARVPGARPPPRSRSAARLPRLDSRARESVAAVAAGAAGPFAGARPWRRERASGAAQCLRTCAGWHGCAAPRSRPCALTGRRAPGAGGNPYATPETSHHPNQELAASPKLAPEAHNGKPAAL